jgi:hypothetical protein
VFKLTLVVLLVALGRVHPVTEVPGRPLPHVGGFEWGVKTPVSLQSLLPRSYFADARAVPSSDTTGFSVEVLFSAEGLDALAALLGSPDPVDSHLDWYAALHRAGEPITEMRAVVTFRNAALIPFSVNEVVDRKRPGEPIAIAKGLTLQAAETLVGDLRK